MSPRLGRTFFALGGMAILVGCASPAPPPENPPAAATSIPAPTDDPVTVASDNLALGKPAAASASLLGSPSLAVDGDPDTAWSAGRPPAQWIEIDLGAEIDIDRLSLTPSQSPDGATVHVIWGRAEAGDSRRLVEHQAVTADGSRFEVFPQASWGAVRYLRIETTDSPSWVAWREIEVYGAPARGAPQAATGEPDTIFHNGHLLTMERDRPSASAVAIAGETIVAVGSDDEVLALAGAATRIIDLDGRTLTPGFIDAHSHRFNQFYKWGFASAEQVFPHALRQGWTGLTELYIDEGNWHALVELANAGDLPMRVDAYLLFNTFDGSPLPTWYDGVRPGERIGPHLRAAGLKFFIDFNSGRVLFFDPPGLAEQMRLRRAEGWQIALKAIGAQSHELALEAIEQAEAGREVVPARYRIEHALAQRPDQQARMARLGVIASIQPGIVGVIASWPDIQALIVEQGAPTVANWRGLADAGVRMAGSPLNPDGVNEEYAAYSHASPIGVLYRGVTQIGLAGRQPAGWMLDHALRVDEILRLLTIDAAYAIFQEDTRGSLAPGKLADLVVLSGDPLTVSPTELLAIDVLMTMVGGRSAYCAPDADALCPGEG